MTGLPLTSKDVISITSLCSISGIRLTLFVRTIDEDNKIQVLAFSHEPNSDLTNKETISLLGAGQIISASLNINFGAVRRGECFVICAINHGIGASRIPIQTLISNYIETGHQLTFPGSQILSSFNGHGRMKLIVGPDPAAGAEAILTVPTNLIWRIISFEVILTTDATVATRVPHMILDDGAVTFLDIKTNADVTASETESFQWCSGIPDDISSNPALHGMPVDLILPAGFRVKTDTSSLQAGDNYAKPHLMVEEWIQD